MIGGYITTISGGANLLLSIGIILTSVWGYRKIEKVTPLYFGAAYTLFAASHVLVLIGVNDASDLLLDVLFVALRIGGWSGTVTATAIYLEGIPSNLLPIVEQTFIIRTNVNGTYVAALAVIYPFAVNATGAMQIYPDIPGNLWTVGNTCGNPSDSTVVYEILP